MQPRKEPASLSIRKSIKKKRREHLISLFGTSPIDLTLEELEKARGDESPKNLK